MDIDEIRRANMVALQSVAGSTQAAADIAGMSYAQWFNYRNGAKEPKTGKVRGMRKETAWKIEDAFKKPRGWLDQNHNQYQATMKDQEFAHRVEQELARYEVSDQIKQAIIGLITTSPPKHAGSSLADHPVHEEKAA